jgi:hypothetical protein
MKKVPTKKVILVSVLCVLLLGGGVLAFSLKTNNSRVTSPIDDKNGTNEKSNTMTNPQPADNPKTPVENESKEAPQSPEALNVSITASNQNGTVIQIRTLIDSIESGTCVLSMTKERQVVTRTTDTQPLANASTCKGFDIPTSELSPGTWNLSIDIAVGIKHATVTKVLTIT